MPFQNQDIINLLNVDELREVSNLTELTRSNIATLRYFEEREGAIFSAARARQGGGDTSLVIKLKIAIVQLFEVCNQSITLGYTCPATTQLTVQMENRLHCCIDTLSQIVKDIKPEKVDQLPPSQAGPTND